MIILDSSIVPRTGCSHAGPQGPVCEKIAHGKQIRVQQSPDVFYYYSVISSFAPNALGQNMDVSISIQGSPVFLSPTAGSAVRFPAACSRKARSRTQTPAQKGAVYTVRGASGQSVSHYFTNSMFSRNAIMCNAGTKIRLNEHPNDAQILKGQDLPPLLRKDGAARKGKIINRTSSRPKFGHENDNCIL